MNENEIKRNAGRFISVTSQFALMFARRPARASRFDSSVTAR
ncbi:MAG: hypothetical protein Q8O74_05140 [bacterium]|nr:hypothetical protein [bacterium]